MGVQDEPVLLDVKVDRDAEWIEGIRAVTVTYRVGEYWHVVLTANMDAATERDFHSVEFRPAPDADPAEGVNSNLLRLIPFREAAAEVDRAIMGVVREYAPDLPEQFETPLDFARLAECYAFWADAFPGQPLKQMSDAYTKPDSDPIKRNTLAARVNRAKSLGLLERNKMTAKAMEILHAN